MSTSPATFPRQDIPDSEKTLDWGKSCINYVVDRFRDRRLQQIRKMNRLYKSYNGVVDAQGLEFLNKTYGKENIVKYIDYRLGRTKIEILNGEWLQMPLNKTVMTINESAKMRKLDELDLLFGAMMAKPQLEEQKKLTGIDSLNGMPIPEIPADGSNPMAVFNSKSKNEIAMQRILNNAAVKMDLKMKFGENLLDTEIASECHGKVELKLRNGKYVVDYRDIDPRDALFEEVDRDPFLLKTPYYGERRIMFIHDVISEYELNDTEKEQLRETGNAFVNGDSNNENQRSYFQLIQNQLAVEVYIIEWKTICDFYVLEQPNKLNPGSPYKKYLTYDQYKKEQKIIKKKVAEGEYKLSVVKKECIYEIHRIGYDIYKRFGKKNNIIASYDNPYQTEFGYGGMLFRTRDGVRISLQENLDNISRVYNIVMFQINRELAKAKGKIVAYDRAYLPKGKTMKDVLYRMTNDGIYDYNSSEDGNISGERIDIRGQIQEVDLGVSQTVQQLIAIKLDLQEMADRLTGINENRQGNIAASMTATNAMASMSASRSITFSMFYYFDRFCENIMRKICEYEKIRIGLLDQESGSSIVGDELTGFLEVTKDIALDDFGVAIFNAQREKEIRDIMRSYAQQSINAQQLRVEDALNFELAETLPEAKQALRNGWQEVRRVAEQDHSNKMEQIAAQAEQQRALAQEDREDWQQHEKELAQMKGQQELSKVGLKGKNDYITKNSMLQQETQEPEF